MLFVTALLTVASAAENYKVSLFYPSVIGEAELRPGNCQLTVDDSHVVIKQGRKTVEAEVKVESTEQENKKTTVRYRNGDGKYRISEIRLGGTSKKLLFN